MTKLTTPKWLSNLEIIDCPVLWLEFLRPSSTILLSRLSDLLFLVQVSLNLVLLLLCLHVLLLLLLVIWTHMIVLLLLHMLRELLAFGSLDCCLRILMRVLLMAKWLLGGLIAGVQKELLRIDLLELLRQLDAAAHWLVRNT